MARNGERPSTSTTEEPSTTTTTPEPGLQLGEFVDIEDEDWEGAQPTRESLGVISPDRMLQMDGRTNQQDLEEKIEGEEEEKEEEGIGGVGGSGVEEERTSSASAQPQIRQFEGTSALALPSERGQRLDILDLELQVRPTSPNGVVLYAASSLPSAKEVPPFMHTLELANGQAQYKFMMGGEIEEILLSDVQLPLEQWSTIKVSNDGRGKASLRVNSSPAKEMFYSPGKVPPPNVPSRVYLGGIDPSRAKHSPKSINFIGTIGRVRMNRKELDLGEQRVEGRAENEQITLDQQENQCSREPCRNSGRCHLNRWGGFQCDCLHGFSGKFCELPSMDGVCPGGQRWCHRGICAQKEGTSSSSPQCLCPLGWEGIRCEAKISRTDISEQSGIRFDGRNSFLAIPLHRQGDGGEEAREKGFAVEFRLSSDPGRTGPEQLVALMVSSEQFETATALGMQGEKFWAIQHEANEPSTKRFLTKRIKSKKTHRLRLEQSGPGEIQIFVEGRPKGIFKMDTGPEAMLLLGGKPPRGISLPAEMEKTLVSISSFAGCVDELSLNGKALGWSELGQMNGAALESCEGGKFVEQVPTTLVPLFSVSQDPMLAAEEQKGGERLIGTEGEPIDADWGQRHPFLVDFPSTNTATPDPLLTTTERPSLPSTTMIVPFWPINGDHNGNENEIEQIEPTPSPTEILTTKSPQTTSTSPEPTTLMPVPPRPTWITHPDSDELEEGPFPGLCHPKMCGQHGSCEEVNNTHVICVCRDYWVGQTCEEFRPIEYAAKFDGNAFVVFSSDEFPHLISDREETVQFKVRTKAKYGLIFWQGQQPPPGEEVNVVGEDYLSIGLLDGHLAFSYELGGGAAQMVSEWPINDGKTHLVKVIRQGRNGSLQIDGLRPVRGRSSGILTMLNVESHIFVGGVPDLHLMTAGIHTQNFVGCLAELTLNEHRVDLMGNAIDGRNVRPCRGWRAQRRMRKRQWLRQLRRLRKAAREQRFVH